MPDAPRLGDTLDDYCPRCRLLLAHNVAALVAGEIKKVVCNTCHTEHPYRHGKGASKKEEVASLFAQVLGKRGNGGDPERKPPRRRKG